MSKFLKAIVPLILTAGATLLLLLILLSGVRDNNPLNRIFYLEADTSSISGAPPLTRWTLWNRCGVSDGINSDCTANHPAYAFQPDVNFGTTSGVPTGLMDHHSRNYYLSRFSFAFYFIATGFSAFGFIAGFLALCSRIGSGITSFFTFMGFVTAAIAASLSTALYVYARDAFRDAGNDAHLGVKMFAFAWTSVACLFISSIGFLMACCTGGNRRSRNYGEIDDEKAYDANAASPAYGSTAPVLGGESAGDDRGVSGEEEQGSRPGRGVFFRRRKDKYPEVASDGQERQKGMMHQPTGAGPSTYGAGAGGITHNTVVDEQSSYVYEEPRTTHAL